MPKDVNNPLGSVEGLDPDDLTDTAFKLVTILVNFCFFVNSTTPSLQVFPQSFVSGGIFQGQQLQQR